jgi:hypothetical protein
MQGKIVDGGQVSSLVDLNMSEKGVRDVGDHHVLEGAADGFENDDEDHTRDDEGHG